jgi:hypothetical protein
MQTPNNDRGDELRRRSGVGDLSPLVLWFYRQWWPWAIGAGMAALGALAEGNPWLLVVAVVAAAVGGLQWRDAKRG